MTTESFGGTATSAQIELKNRLREFWNKQEAYWDTASSEASVSSPARARALSFVPDGGLVLDVACGSGANVQFLQTRCRYIGVDIAMSGLRRAAQDSRSVVCADVEAAPFPSGAFDAVIATYVLEHSTQPRRFLSELARITRSHGRIVLLGPAWDFPFWYPNSLRSKGYSVGWRLGYATRRTLGQISGRIFGQYPFQAVTDPDALHSEFLYDADAVYIVWTYEVIRWMQQLGAKLIHWEVDDQLLGRHSVVRSFKKFLMRFSAYEHAGSTVLLVFER
jgi:SAM-dependent methyltransferase